MSKTFRKDLTGQRFGRLTVLEFVPTDNVRSYWRCRCDCGNICVVQGISIKSGHTKSCGCLSSRYTIRERRTTHGKRYTRIYKIWAGMNKRCYNKNCQNYKHYGGRGISVCDEWKNNFQVFYDWAMANGYSDDLSIDRIDVNGNYEPSNCRWATKAEQNRNTRINIVVEYKGTRMCLAEAAERSGINEMTLYNRYYRGDRGERLFRPLEK